MTGQTWSKRDWRVDVTATEVTIGLSTRVQVIAARDAAEVALTRRWWRWRMILAGETVLVLRSLRRGEARAMGDALTVLAAMPAIADAVSWRADVLDTLATASREQRWLPTETVQMLAARRPAPELPSRIAAVGGEALLDDGQRAAVEFSQANLTALAAETNEQVTAAELESQRGFFEMIEKSPLSEEQARAVICFDNRVQVLAAAGSGKTSVMVARAAYAVQRGFVAPERILLLAFNRAAAAELQQRVTERFASAGIDASGVRASTFHSFGLSVIGQATGRKPRLARWLDDGGDVEMVVRIVDELRDRSPSFRQRWDIYRLLFANAPVELGEERPDGYDPATKTSGYRTFGGDIVKSHGERLIADFLFLNGVSYVYERAYEIDVADEAHSQYRPDFYYPDIDVWHEHWALDRDGNPPPDFEGYADGIAWKRELHARHDTTLIETTWADVVFGDGLDTLQRQLSELGVVFDWNPDRAPVDEWVKPMEHETLARLVRTFMAHVKSNSFTEGDLDQRVRTELPRLEGLRTRLFLHVYWQIHDEWQRRLAADDAVDFEDMLVAAAGHLDAGATDPGYELIMVDEFQDASRARARLVQGLLRQPGRYLLAVGDDWQAINRFAGADISIMTNFESWFGPGPRIALTTTYRCPQTVCDVAHRFVAKNPAQLDKPMRSSHPGPGAPVVVKRCDSPEHALAEYLQELSERVADDPNTTSATVDVLGRYGFERDLLPHRIPGNLQVTFRTTHGAKGLEADYIVVANMSNGTYGFPSNIGDDPVLAVAMPQPKPFPDAEERRLFYVALTRARRQVTLLTPNSRMSRFVLELLDDPDVQVEGTDGTPVELCPQCGQGTIVERRSQYGPFWACDAFPACTYKRKRPGKVPATP